MCFILVSLFVVRLVFMSVCHKFICLYILLFLYYSLASAENCFSLLCPVVQMYYSFLTLLAPGSIGFL